MSFSKINLDPSRKIFDFINFNDGIIFDISVLLICCLSFYFSWIESTVNQDAHHWGHMYITALDLKRGLIPHKEVFIQYGCLTSWIQSISIYILGEHIKSVGIVTGLFYSLSLLLLYKIFLKITPKYLAYFSTFFVFLLHSYPTLPWSNYYAFTFQLLAVALFLTNKNIPRNALLSGFFLGLSFLSRYSSIIATLPPFLIFLIYEYITKKNYRKLILNKAVYFWSGFLIIVVLFGSFLLYHSSFNDFLIQNKVHMASHGASNSFALLTSLLGKIVKAEFDAGRKLTAYLYTLNFFVSILAILYLSIKFSLGKNLNRNENIVIMICLVSLFGYLNSAHIYEVFRLNNGASIGFLIVLCTLVKVANLVRSKLKVAVLLPLIVTCFVLAKSQPITHKLSFVWSEKGIKANEISLFEGKILSPSFYSFYHEIFQAIQKLNCSCMIINFTGDTIAIAINDLPRVQISPWHYGPQVQAYPAESKEVQRIIDEKKAVIITRRNLDIPGYKVIFSKYAPIETGFGKDGKKLYIIAPSES